MKVIIIGGIAAGMSAAKKIKRMSNFDYFHRLYDERVINPFTRSLKIA